VDGATHKGALMMVATENTLAPDTRAAELKKDFIRDMNFFERSDEN